MPSIRVHGMHYTCTYIFIDQVLHCVPWYTVYVSTMCCFHFSFSFYYCELLLSFCLVDFVCLVLVHFNSSNYLINEFEAYCKQPTGNSKLRVIRTTYTFITIIVRCIWVFFQDTQANIVIQYTSQTWQAITNITT